MELTNRMRVVRPHVRLGRIAAAILAACGLFALVFAPDTAGASSKTLVISTTKNSTLGTILVSGTTVYTLQSNGVACTAKCLKYWPEVLLPKGVTKATAAGGAAAAKLGVLQRPGGALQVTYAGKPLYWFSKDKAPGQVKGNAKDTWGKWSVVVTAKASSGGTTTTTKPGATTTTTSPGGGGVGF